MYTFVIRYAICNQENKLFNFLFFWQNQFFRQIKLLSLATKIGYNIDILQQIQRMAVNPIVVYNLASFLIKRWRVSHQIKSSRKHAYIILTPLNPTFI